MFLGERGVGQHLLGPCGTHHGAQHRPGGVEGFRAARRRPVVRRLVDDRRPPLGLGRLADQGGDPAGQDGQGWVRPDRGVTEGGHPPLDRRDLPRAVGRRHQLGHELRTPVAVGRGQQVVDRHARGAVGPEPVRGTHVQRLDHLRVGASELAEQEVPEERVVAVPLPSPVERDQEGVRRLEGLELLVSARLPQDRVAQRSVEPLEHRGAAQEVLRDRVQLAQRLPGGGSPRRSGRPPTHPTARPARRARSWPPGAGPPASPRCAR